MVCLLRTSLELLSTADLNTHGLPDGKCSSDPGSQGALEVLALLPMLPAQGRQASVYLRLEHLFFFFFFGAKEQKWLQVAL